MDEEGDEIVRFETRYEVKAVGCRCRFCPKCCTHLGLKLRERLIPILETFAHTMMLTLTIDPKLFESPEEAYWYVRDKRAITELVRALRKAGYLITGRFFYVVEWHKNGWPHFHLLVEARHIPHKELARLWGRHRPKTAPKWRGSYARSLKGQSPEFGSVLFSKRAFKSAKHAACYAIKYMIKQPEQGYPEWVMDSTRQIKLYSTSRGLLPSKRKQKLPHGEACFCHECRGEEIPSKVRPQRSVRERLGDCGTQAALLRVMWFFKANGEAIRSKEPKFLCLLPLSFHQTIERFQVEGMDVRKFFLRDNEVESLKPILHPRFVARHWPKPGPAFRLRKREATACL